MAGRVGSGVNVSSSTVRLLLLLLPTNTLPVTGSTAAPKGVDPAGKVATTWLVVLLITLTEFEVELVKKTLPVWVLTAMPPPPSSPPLPTATLATKLRPLWAVE